MYYVYIARSEKTKKHYVGYTSNLRSRLAQHNSGASKFTKSGVPWVIVHSEEFENRDDAWRRERKIKSYKGGRAFKALVESRSYGEVA